MRLSLAFHVIGIIFWVGALMIIPTFLRSVKKGVDPQAKIVSASRSALMGYLLPGALITTISGLYQISMNGAAYYFKQGWFHGKLTGVIVLFIATGLLFAEIRRLSQGLDVRSSRLSMIHGIAGLAFLANVFLTILMR